MYCSPLAWQAFEGYQDAAIVKAVADIWMAREEQLQSYSRGQINMAVIQVTYNKALVFIKETFRELGQ